MIFGFLGTTEIVIILVVALLVFGPQKLPEIGKQIGMAVREVNRMRNEVTRALDLDEYGHNRYDNQHNQSYTYPTYNETPVSSGLEAHESTAELPAYGAPVGATHAYGAVASVEGSSSEGVTYDTYGTHDSHQSQEMVPPPGPKRNSQEEVKEL